MNFTAFLGWFSPTRWVVLTVAAVLIAAAFATFVAHQRAIGDARTSARYEAVLAEQRDAAAAKMAQVLKAHSDFKNAQEIKDAKNRKISIAQSNRLRELATSGLRDPNAAGGPSSDGSAPVAAGAGTDDAAETYRLLSRELSELLQLLTSEADEINDAYASCRAHATQPE